MATTHAGGAILRRSSGRSRLTCRHEVIGTDAGAPRSGRGYSSVDLAGTWVREGSAPDAAGIAFFSSFALVAWAHWELLTYEIGVEFAGSADAADIVECCGRRCDGALLLPSSPCCRSTVPVVVGPRVMLAALIRRVRQELDYTALAAPWPSVAWMGRRCVRGVLDLFGRVARWRHARPGSAVGKLSSF